MFLKYLFLIVCIFLCFANSAKSGHTGIPCGPGSPVAPGSPSWPWCKEYYMISLCPGETVSLRKCESFSHSLQTDPSPSLLNIALKNIWYERQGPDLLLTIGPISPGGPGAPVFPRSPWRITRHHQKGPPKNVIFNPSSHCNSCANHTFPCFKHIGNNNTRMFNLGGRYFVCVCSHTLHWRTTTKKMHNKLWFRQSVTNWDEANLFSSDARQSDRPEETRQSLTEDKYKTNRQVVLTVSKCSWSVWVRSHYGLHN